MGDFVDLLLEDPAGIDSLTLTVAYTADTASPTLLWCDRNGEWQTAAAGTVDQTNKRITLVITDASSPSLSDLEGTPAVVANFTPLAVTLGWFLAERNGENVDVRWQTATETGVAGFHLLAVTQSGNQRLNADLIPSTVIDSVTPTDYQLAVQTDATHFLLQQVGIAGDVTEMGPFELGVAFGDRSEAEPSGPGENRPDAAGRRIYLPLINNSAP